MAMFEPDIGAPEVQAPVIPPSSCAYSRESLVVCKDGSAPTAPRFANSLAAGCRSVAMSDLGSLMCSERPLARWLRLPSAASCVATSCAVASLSAASRALGSLCAAASCAAASRSVASSAFGGLMSSGLSIGGLVCHWQPHVQRPLARRPHLSLGGLTCGGLSLGGLPAAAFRLAASSAASPRSASVSVEGMVSVFDIGDCRRSEINGR